MPGEEALAELVYHWGSAYRFAYNARPGNRNPYEAIRRDGQGLIRAADPETLFAAVTQDYQARPVLRSLAP